MTLFLTYELKVAVLIAVFYIFWRLLVANETWHRLNRIVLLGSDAPCDRYASFADRRDGYAYRVSPNSDKHRDRTAL